MGKQKKIYLSKSNSKHHIPVFPNLYSQYKVTELQCGRERKRRQKIGKASSSRFYTWFIPKIKIKPLSQLPFTF